MKKEISNKEVLEVVNGLAESVNDLAESVNVGFNGVQKQFNGVQKQFNGIQKQFDGINERFESVDSQLKELRQGQESMDLKMSNVAYRFELIELQNRVKKLEEKLEA